MALLVEITFFRLIFIAVGGKVELFCLIWGVYARFVKKMDYSLQLILLLTLEISIVFPCYLHLISSKYVITYNAFRDLFFVIKVINRQPCMIKNAAE